MKFNKEIEHYITHYQNCLTDMLREDYFIKMDVSKGFKIYINDIIKQGYEDLFYKSAIKEII